MEFKILEEMFKEESPSSVFEIGCANGGLLLDLTRHYNHLEVGGLDINRTDLEKAKNLFPKYKEEFVFHNINEFPWPIEDKKYDIVFSVGVLMYIFDVEPVLKEMLRISRKLIIAEYYNGELDSQGILAREYLEDGKISAGIKRNYIDSFKNIGIIKEMRVKDNKLFKSIIKCTQ